MPRRERIPVSAPAFYIAVAGIAVIGSLVALNRFVLRNEKPVATAPGETPEATVTVALDAIMRKDCEVLFRTFSSDTRRSIDFLDDLASEEGGSAPYGDAICQTLPGMRAEYFPVASVKVISNDGSRSVVRVRSKTRVAGTDASDLSLVREASVWKLDLTDELDRAIDQFRRRQP